MAINVIERMRSFIATCDDPSRLRVIAKNAERNGADILFREAKLRLYEILPAEKPGTLEHSVWKSIHALEDVLSTERGMTVRLSRTRQKIQRVGELKTVADLTLGPASDGYAMLESRNMLELAFEAVALRHAEHFEKNVLDAARVRLAASGYRA